MGVHLPHNLKKNFPGSSVLYRLLIVLKVAMELTLAVWNSKVCGLDFVPS